MSTSIQHPRNNASLSAAECALMRWWPQASLAIIDQVHALFPNYPVIRGGRGETGIVVKEAA